MADMTESRKKTIRWPYFSMSGPAAKHPISLPAKAMDDMSDVWIESKA